MAKRRYIRMSSINVDSDTKAKFDALQPENSTQAEFVAELLDTFEAHESDSTVHLDVDALVDSITKQTATEVELAAHRGVTQAIEDYE